MLLLEGRATSEAWGTSLTDQSHDDDATPIAEPQTLLQKLMDDIAADEYRGIEVNAVRGLQRAINSPTDFDDIRDQVRFWCIQAAHKFNLSYKVKFCTFLVRHLHLCSLDYFRTYHRVTYKKVDGKSVRTFGRPTHVPFETDDCLFDPAAPVDRMLMLQELRDHLSPWALSLMERLISEGLTQVLLEKIADDTDRRPGYRALSRLLNISFAEAEVFIEELGFKGERFIEE